MFGFDIDWSQIGSHLWHLIIAYTVAIPVGWNREREERSAGLRTFPLVSMAACGYMIIGMQVLSTTDAESRVIYGIITGIGFIGGGAILRKDSGVTGTATAASIWNTGAMGVAVAFNRLEIAIVLSLLNFLTLQYVATLKPIARGNDQDESDDD